MKKIFLLIIAFVLNATLYAQKEDITLEDIWKNYTFRPKSISEIRSLSDGEHYCILTNKGIEEYEYSTGKKLGYYIDFSTLGLDEKTYITDYAISSDNEKVILATNPEYIYRHSFIADYYLYNFIKK